MSTEHRQGGDLRQARVARDQLQSQMVAHGFHGAVHFLTKGGTGSSTDVPYSPSFAFEYRRRALPSR